MDGRVHKRGSCGLTVVAELVLTRTATRSLLPWPKMPICTWVEWSNYCKVPSSRAYDVGYSGDRILIHCTKHVWWINYMIFGFTFSHQSHSAWTTWRELKATRPSHRHAMHPKHTLCHQWYHPPPTVTIVTMVNHRHLARVLIWPITLRAMDEQQPLATQE